MARMPVKQENDVLFLTDCSWEVLITIHKIT